MSKLETFKTQISEGYSFKGDSLILGGAMLDGQAVEGVHVKIPLKSLNRHGLIAGATGTGKTKTLQVFAEQLSTKGIPSLLMDIKGDLSGIGASGTSNDFIQNRHNQIGLLYEPSAMPVELMTLNDGKGLKLKATISEFGPVLMSKILNLNETQSSVISLVFMYCENNKLPLIDLKDLRKVLQFTINEGKEKIAEEYGAVSSATINTIMRKVVELEQQGADSFFAGPSFDPMDLIRLNEKGHGIVSIIRLMDIQDKPKLFSTFMLGLLNEIYRLFPEEGDMDKPKLCVFIDEAHLVFEEASSALLDQLEVIIKLIRSKGIGIYFCTQNPIDIPDAILSQLGLKIQHALRAFTEKDRKAIQKAAENYPISTFYETENLITQLGTGEAFVTTLNEKGIPTPLAHTMLRAPLSRMDILEEAEVNQLVASSQLISKYATSQKEKGAYDILSDQTEEEKDDSRESDLKSDEKLRERQEKERKKLEERKIREEEREKIRVQKEEERLERESSRRRDAVIRDISRAVTTGSRSSRGGGIIGALIRWIMTLFGKK